VFENRVLRKIFGPKGDKVTGRLRKPHKNELYDLYVSPNAIRVIKLRIMGDGACSTYGRQEMCIKGFRGGRGGMRKSDNL
jgi:hypothetical protein